MPYIRVTFMVALSITAAVSLDIWWPDDNRAGHRVPQSDVRPWRGSPRKQGLHIQKRMPDYRFSRGKRTQFGPGSYYTAMQGASQDPAAGLPQSLAFAVNTGGNIPAAVQNQQLGAGMVVNAPGTLRNQHPMALYAGNTAAAGEQQQRQLPVVEHQQENQATGAQQTLVAPTVEGNTAVGDSGQPQTAEEGIQPTLNTQRPEDSYTLGLNATAALEKIMADIQELRTDRLVPTNIKEDLPCKVNGSWLSSVAGVRIITSFDNDGQMIVKLVNHGSPGHPQLLSDKWEVWGTTPFPRGGTIMLTAVSKKEATIATMLGLCRVCEGVEIIVAVWMFSREARDCRDQHLSVMELQDVLRRDVKDPPTLQSPPPSHKSEPWPAPAPANVTKTPSEMWETIQEKLGKVF